MDSARINGSWEVKNNFGGLKTGHRSEYLP